nr:MAG TPA: hypothetical protein [Caudoviricetes sp.]
MLNHFGELGQLKSNIKFLRIYNQPVIRRSL